MTALHLSTKQWEDMRDHVAACVPHEACGLLAGHGDAVHEVLPITNRLRSPTRFRMEPSEQIRAFAAIEEGGMELIGIFHSHPAFGGAVNAASPGPSATDIAEAAYPVVHVIWSRPDGQWAAHAYWIESGRLSDVALKIGDAA